MPVRLALICCLALVACGAPKKPTSTGTPPASFCPGGPSCPSGNDGAFKAGIAKVKVTPPSFEKPRLEYLNTKGDSCPEGSPKAADGIARCGELISNAFHDCGLDTLCPGDPGYPGADQGEKDGKPDWFLDCGRDGLCPGDPRYTAPDADGSEGDGKFQGFWLAGFGNNRPLVAVHDDQWARAVVLINGDVSLALVSVDAVGLFHDDVVRIRDRISKKLGDAAPDYVLVSSTHTHEAPDTLGQWGYKEGLIPTSRGVDDAWLTNVLIEGAAQAVADATQSARPANLSATQVKLGDKTSDVISDTRDPWIADDALTVLELTEKSGGDVIGTVVSFGDHPETVGGNNNLLTSDFIGAVRDGVENGVFKKDGSLVQKGVGGTCVFLNGAVGGMMTSLHAHPQSVDGDVPADDTFAKVKAVGDVLAIAALQGLGSATAIPNPPLAWGATELKLPVENEVFQLLFLNFSLLKRRLYDFDASKPASATNQPMVLSEVAKVQVGGLRFLAVPGELLPELAVGYDPYFSFGHPRTKAANTNPPDLTKAPAGPYLKDQLAGDIRCVVGLANDELGYLIPPYDYQLDATHPYLDEAPGTHYEETNSIGPSVTPKLLAAYSTLLGWEPAP
jgi:hypothetical protein